MGRHERPTLYGSVDFSSDLAEEGLVRPMPKPQRRIAVTQWMALGMAGTAMVLAAALVFAQRLDKSPTARGSRRLGTRKGAQTTVMPVKSSLYRGVWNAREDALSTDIPLQFSVENRYGSHVTLDSSPYPWLLNKKLIEPYVNTTLSILVPQDGVTYTWSFRYNESISRVSYYRGSSVTVTLQTTGPYVVTVEALGSDSRKILASSDYDVYVKYVRREVRSLLKDDLDAMMNAASTIWHTSEEDGQELYGDHFHSISYFTGYHLNQAAEADCDHLHDGLGFMTQHAGLTLAFERSLRSVNPSVSVPYWDYTIDIENIKVNKDSNYSQYWFDSEVFTDDYFGTVDETKQTVTTGRWAYVEIEESPYALKNPYGLMRAPWNCNKSKYVTRHSSFCGQKWVKAYTGTAPTCETHYDFVAGYNSWFDFGKNLGYHPHGPIHALTGGSFYCDSTWSQFSELGLSDSFILNMGLESFGLQRAYYRAEILSCPSNCTMDMPQSECLCTCSVDDLISTYGSLDGAIESVVTDSDLQTEIVDADDTTKLALLGIICSGGILLGDHIEAASPYDISFWPIHPTVERLWQAKKLWGMFTDEDWPSGSSMYGDTCVGHDEDDLVPIEDLTPAKPGAATYLTNGQLYEYMNPNYDNLEYIFDDFTWSHCLELSDIDFSNIQLGVTRDDDADVSPF